MSFFRSTYDSTYTIQQRELATTQQIPSKTSSTIEEYISHITKKRYNNKPPTHIITPPSTLICGSKISVIRAHAIDVVNKKKQFLKNYYAKTPCRAENDISHVCKSKHARSKSTHMGRPKSKFYIMGFDIEEQKLPKNIYLFDNKAIVEAEKNMLFNRNRKIVTRNLKRSPKRNTSEIINCKTYSTQSRAEGDLSVASKYDI